jgi:hypothetical protein
VRLTDRERLDARIAALDAAARLAVARGASLAELDKLSGLAEGFERWLLRPAESAAPGQATAAPGGRMECGAFLRPAWYGDAMEDQRPWPVCSGVHNEHGWHIGQEHGESLVFASHHAVGWRDLDVPRCSCGGAEWPCPDAHPTDMRI